MLLQIGQTDYTRKIIHGTYAVNKYDVYKEWQDANCTTHRSILKRRVSGSLTMYFSNQDVFQTFLNDLAAEKNNDGSYTVGVMINNDNQWAPQTDLFIDFRPAREQKVLGVAWYPELQISLQGK